MRILSYASLTGIILLLNSCSPHVATYLFKNYPQTVTPTQVLVYSEYDDVPSQSEVLGEVAVRDNGFSTRCKYDDVIALACRATSLNGGNAFAIAYHSKPSIWGSSCHQIKGVMLRIAPQSDDTTENNDTILASAHETAAFSEQPALSADTLPDHLSPIQRAREIQNREIIRRQVPRHTLLAEMGYSGIYSRFLLPEGCSGNPRSGLSYQLGYEWNSGSGLGAGIIYSGYQSGYQVNLATGSQDIDVILHFVGPLMSYKYRLDKWIFHTGIAVGWSHYQEKIPSLSYSLNGIGIQYNLGVDYRLFNNAALSLTTGYNASSFQENALYQEAQEEQIGIGRFFVNAGIRIYF